MTEPMGGLSAPDTAESASQGGYSAFVGDGSLVAIGPPARGALTVLGLMGLVNLFQIYVYVACAPQISETLGISPSTMTTVRTLALLIGALAPGWAAGLTERLSRGRLCMGFAVAAALCTGVMGVTDGLVAVGAAMLIGQLAAASSLALQISLVFDTAQPRLRVGALYRYLAISWLGLVLAPALLAFTFGPLHLTWRSGFVILGLVGLAAGLTGVVVGEGGTENLDLARLRQLSQAEQAVHSSETPPPTREISQRLAQIPAVKALLLALYFAGAVVVPSVIYFSQMLEDRWNLHGSSEAAALAGMALVAVVGLITGAGRAGQAVSRSLSAALKHAAVLLLAAALLIPIGALLPQPELATVVLILGEAAAVSAIPTLQSCLLGVVDPAYRTVTAALAVIAAGLGVLFGLSLLGSLSSRFGVAGALVAMIGPAAAAALASRRSVRSIDTDLQTMVSSRIEATKIASVVASGGHLPLLACSGINFSYGQLQVLFDVDFTVDDGEMVALLGTNGAGKSTLLKVISGIGIPSSGTVRFRGQDITYLEAVKRVPLGITQVPGGRAVFGTMDVAENLRAYGYSLGRDRRRIEDSIERCFEAFPRLKQRRGSLAANLSGGEQQMLGLSKALILEPKLLLIDELSLGLAPVIVGQLLEMVRQINATGAAVVLVEQSVNIALSLVQHAYFMEKGAMRFDGPAGQLLDRDDLLRAVFLEGAAKAGR